MEPVIAINNKEYADASAPPVWSAEAARLGSKLSETREQLSTTIANARVESYSKFCELSTEITGLTKRLDNLVAEYERGGWKAKFSIGVLSLVLVAAGYLGFHYGYRSFYRDVKDTVTQSLEGEIQQSVITDERSFYDDLVAGNALDGAGQYAQATARLMNCFKAGHYRDTAVLLPLLDSIYKNSDWETAKSVFDVLEKEPAKSGGTTDPRVLAYIGSIEVQGAGVYPDWLEKGSAILLSAQLLTPPGDTATLSMIHTNYWLYDIQRGDWKSADAEISALKELDVPVSTWDTVKRWRFFTQYFTQGSNLGLEPRIRSTWSALRQKASDQ
jgi:hypothetical protein